MYVLSLHNHCVCLYTKAIHMIIRIQYISWVHVYTQLLYTVTLIYTAGFEVVDTEIGREYIPERIYTRPWSTCMYIYCPEGKTKGVN